MSRSRSPLPPFAKWLTALLLLHVFAAILLAASPALHERLHHDADADDHDCAVVMVAHGHCDSLVATVQCPAPLEECFAGWISRRVENPVALGLEGSALGRAPPLRLS